MVGHRPTIILFHAPGIHSGKTLRRSPAVHMGRLVRTGWRHGSPVAVGSALSVMDNHSALA